MSSNPLKQFRPRNYKSCIACRRAKTRCEGLEESYLRALDDPSFSMSKFGSPPRCKRCKERRIACCFEATRRKGRPPVVRDSPPPRGPSLSPPLPSSLSISGSRAPQGPGFALPAQMPPPSLPSTHPTTLAKLSRRRDEHNSFPPPRPRPTSSPYAVGVPRPSKQSLGGSVAGNIRLPSVSRSHRLDLELICKSYLAEVHSWKPLLSPRFDNLAHYLSTCDPILLVSIDCVVHPLVIPPPFPSSGPHISLARLQSSIFFCTQAFGIGDEARAIEIIAWSMRQYRSLGWNGDDPSALSRQIQPKEITVFIDSGWMVHAICTWLGVLTGNRILSSMKVELANVVSSSFSFKPPSPRCSRGHAREITLENMMHHALSLFRDATDFDLVETLSLEDRSSYLGMVKARSDAIYRAAVKFLDSTTPHFDSQDILEQSTLIVAAARETAFSSAIIVCASSILLLARIASRPHFLSPPISGDLSGHPTLSTATREAISRASQNALAPARTTRNRRGRLLSFDQHCPSFGSFVLVAAYGSIVAADCDPNAEGGGGRRTIRQIERDLELCDFILQGSKGKMWPQTEGL
ncbi:Zn(II)2Cys6 transcription factor domain-containing protein [Sporobolomyces salmoneus]|uniref:Zn(II)2Cys6 transcription factor domain-containing protein n=1 Tax=Sporobolomyces salmoneus TaxID=183962 RepID=UPI00317C5BDE